MAAPAQTTKRRTEAEPEDEALLIVAHGDRGGMRADRLAREIARRMRGSRHFCDVGIAFVAGVPRIDAVARGLKGTTVRVCPLFMSDGYYVRKAIPEQLGLDSRGITAGRRYTLMQAAGLNPRLPPIVADIAAGAAVAAGIAVPKASLLIVAHGSGSDPASRLAAEAAARAIAATRRFAGVDTAFLEEPPLLDERLHSLPGPLIVSGFFVGEGMHGVEDMAAAVAATGRGDLYPAPPLARSESLIAAVCAEILAT